MSILGSNGSEASVPSQNAPGCLQHLRVIPLGMTTAADSQKFASLREHEERRISETVGLRVANHRMIAYLMNISIRMLKII